MKAKSGSNRADVVQTFRRTIHQGKFPRNGLSAARVRAQSHDFPRIVSTLGAQPIYRNLFAILSFPAKPEQLINLHRLSPIDKDGEFIWTASVLRLFSKKINDFVIRRDDFYKNLTIGDYEAAELMLDGIQAGFGYSAWLIQSRLQLLQLYKGLEAQKNYVEDLLSTNGIGALTAWLAYLFSLRTEENVSFAKLQDELASVLVMDGLGDYVLHHVAPYDLTGISHPEVPIIWDEPHSIIDRYETFVSMLQVEFARKNKFSDALMVALKQLIDISDLRLDRLRMIISGGLLEAIKVEVIDTVDLYTSGKYSLIADQECELLELIARKRILWDASEANRRVSSLREQIILGMNRILSLSSDSQQQRLRLKKIALSLPKHPYAFQIAAFLERSHDFVLTGEYSELDYLAAINSPLENPWLVGLISKISSMHNWMEVLIGVRPGSPSLLLRRALLNSTSTEIGSAVANDIPAYRRDVYFGHMDLLRGDREGAISNYAKAVSHENSFVSSHAKRYLYDALYSAERYSECLSLAVEHILENNVAVFSYAIDDLAKACLEDENLLSDISLAILLHLNVVHVHHRWERELSDVFENVLADLGVDRPSQLIHSEKKFPKKQQVYFLRYICTPRILDDTTCFDNVDEIEAERIAICQYLLSLDQADKEEYLSEIRGLTRDTNVAHLFKKVQSSKIYVDEAGLRQSFETTLLETFLRYQRLLDSPALAYQAEKISKILEEMLMGKGGAELKELKLPASEREALFETLVADFCVEFAFNPAYGLDTHVSTTIRHGAFEGHVRTPFAAEDLLCKKKNNEFILSRSWEEKLIDFSSDDLLNVKKHLGRFTSKIEDLIKIYLAEKIRVKEVGNNGMFVFESTRAEIAELRESITKATDYNTFLEKFFEHAWRLVDDSMQMIRADLEHFLLQQVNLACDNLATALDHSFGHDRIATVVDAIVRAQTNFQSGLVEVAEWFRRPQDLSRDPFDFEVAVHVAIQQISNCYVGTPLEPVFELNVPGQIEGKLVDGICEIFFILLQNVILHSGFGDRNIGVQVQAKREGNLLIISCENDFSEDVNIKIRKQIANEAMSNYQRDTAMRLARIEGGSGLSKIWRIAEYDLRVTHQVKLEIVEDRSFRATVTLGLW